MEIQKKITEAAPYLGSSVDPEKVSMTLKSLVPLVVLLLATFKIDVPQTDIDTYVLALATTINGLITLWAAVRRVAIYLKSRIKK